MINIRMKKSVVISYAPTEYLVMKRMISIPPELDGIDSDEIVRSPRRSVHAIKIDRAANKWFFVELEGWKNDVGDKLVEMDVPDGKWVYVDLRMKHLRE